MRKHFAAIAVAASVAVCGVMLWKQLLPSTPVDTAPSASNVQVHRDLTQAPTATREEVLASEQTEQARQAPSRTKSTSRPVEKRRDAEIAPKAPADPALLVKQRRADIKAASTGLAEELQLTKQEYERLLDLMASHSIQDADRIGSQHGSIVTAPSPPTEYQHRQVVALLGEGRAQKYLHYLATLPIRTQVERFRVELGESNTLTDSQVSRLVAAIDEQRMSYMAHVKTQYSGMTVDFGMGMWYGATLLASRDQGTPRSDQLKTQMIEYNERLFKAASSVLSQSQLEVFRWTQQDRVAATMTRIQSMDIGE